MFGNGGDRTDKNTPEQDVCEELGIHMVFGLGGGKAQSSSELVEKSPCKTNQ
jgi:D-beta-D-heptose 7-phosphate kinase/D-beta-D-heptose 1-phosphate adenosyltransferase